MSEQPQYERTMHMCIDIAGVLRWPNKDLAKLFSDPSGVERSGAYIRDWLKLQLAQGKRVLPMGECEGFDYQTGCPGHPIQSQIYEVNQTPASDGMNEKTILESESVRRFRNPDNGETGGTI